MEIKELRQSLGLSQSEFAKEFGFSVRTLQKWEQCAAQPPVYLIGLLRRLISFEYR